jgi:hypothetical protein
MWVGFVQVGGSHILRRLRLSWLTALNFFFGCASPVSESHANLLAVEFHLKELNSITGHARGCVWICGNGENTPLPQIHYHCSICLNDHDHDHGHDLWIFMISQCADGHLDSFACSETP